MNPKPKIYELLYVSTMAPTSPISAVASIAATSRAWNAAHDITGVLIFDGIQFCQQLEGRQQEVIALFESISRDVRHTAVTLVYHGALPDRRFMNFSLAFTDVEDTEVLGRIRALHGEPGLAAFEELLLTLDIEGERSRCSRQKP